MENDQARINKRITRKDFLRTAALSAGAVFLPKGIGLKQYEFPKAEKLGRIAAGMVDIKLKPDYDAPNVGTYYEDAVIPWYQEVIGPWPFRNNQRWIETDDGFVWGPNVQPVEYELNEPIGSIPDGMEGLWVEVTVPWVNVELINQTPASTWLIRQGEKNLPPRFYFSQVYWIDEIKVNADGGTYYRARDRYGNPRHGDIFWAPAEAFRPISESDLAPIHPDAEEKQIVVDITDSHQTLSCFEEGREVYFCRISSGKVPNTTPLSSLDSAGFPIWRKLHSLQMSGGTNQAGWELPGIGWTSLFLGSGIAIHSTYWHNNFGEPSSHGCINASPEDAKWIFRWSSPVTPYHEGDIDVSGSGGTPVKIIEY